VEVELDSDERAESCERYEVTDACLRKFGVLVGSTHALALQARMSIVSSFHQNEWNLGISRSEDLRGRKYSKMRTEVGHIS
jgi:hypothetical protein